MIKILHILSALDRVGVENMLFTKYWAEQTIKLSNSSKGVWVKSQLQVNGYDIKKEASKIELFYEARIDGESL